MWLKVLDRKGRERESERAREREQREKDIKNGGKK